MRRSRWADVNLTKINTQSEPMRGGTSTQRHSLTVLILPVLVVLRLARAARLRAARGRRMAAGLVRLVIMPTVRFAAFRVGVRAVLRHRIAAARVEALIC